MGRSIPLANSKETAPPPYSYYPDSDNDDAERWRWSRKRLVCIIIIVVVVVVGAIVGAVLGSRAAKRASAYPDYSQLTYTLQDDYSGTSFFDNFDYYATYDKAEGLVHYVDQATAVAQNLTYAGSSSAVLKVDTTDTSATTGRRSVKIMSKSQYNQGLFIFDILTTPYGCATWPALWLSDESNWPVNGEIDVMEAVNKANDGNQMTLHTNKGCKMDRKRKETGTVLQKDCYNATNDNAGCGVQGVTDTFGEGFNANGGGVYAMEWRSEGIRVWFFPRSSIPSDISNGTSPDPSGWGEALADFPNTDCNIDNHFKNHTIIANIDLCGQWAGTTSVYSTEGGCPGTCTNFVAYNNTAFETAVWEFKSWKVYQFT